MITYSIFLHIRLYAHLTSYLLLLILIHIYYMCIVCLLKKNLKVAIFKRIIILVFLLQFILNFVHYIDFVQFDFDNFLLI